MVALLKLARPTVNDLQSSSPHPYILTIFLGLLDEPVWLDDIQMKVQCHCREM